MHLREFLWKIKAGTEELNYGRDILANYALEIAAARQSLLILDIGLGSGKDLLNIRGKCRQARPNLNFEY